MLLSPRLDTGPPENSDEVNNACEPTASKRLAGPGYSPVEHRERVVVAETETSGVAVVGEG
jgi:hypothetical protein